MTDICAQSDLLKKYQPRLLEEKFDGLESGVNRFLASSIARNRLPRLLALTGPRGSSKGTTAKIIARRHCCEQKDQHPFDACLKCNGCKSIEGQAGSVRFSGFGYTEFDATTMDGQKIVEIIEYESNFNSLEGDARPLFCIDEIMRSKTGIQQRLLRIAENTKSSVIICTIEPGNLLPELLDRFTHFNLRLPTTAQIVKGLTRIAGAEGYQIESAAAEHIAQVRANNPRMCVSTLGVAIIVADGANIDVPVIDAALELDGLGQF